MVKYMLSFLLYFPNWLFEDVKRKTDASLREREKSQSASSQQIIRPNSRKKIIRNITYSLPCPNPIDFKISVVCWKNMAKVYTRKDEYAAETVYHNDVIWFTFSVIHRGKDFGTTELLSLHPSAINFQITDDPKHLLQKAALDKLGDYCYSQPTDSDDSLQFRELFRVSTKPQLLKKAKSTASVANEISLNTKSTYNQKFTKQPHPEDEGLGGALKLHMSKIKKFVQKSTFKSSPRSSKKHSRYSRVSNLHPLNETLTFETDKLFYDKLIWTIRSKNKSPPVTIFFSSRPLMDGEARKALNPIGIMIQEIRNLPLDEISKYSIQNLRIQYDLRPLLPVTISDVLNIEESTKYVKTKWLKTFFTNKCPPLELVSLLQTKKLQIKVFGQSNVKKDEVVGRVFGRRIDDYNLSKFVRTQPTRTETEEEKDVQEVLLGSAEVDLSPLVFLSGCVMEYAQVTSNPIMENPGNLRQDCHKYFNVADIHIDQSPKIRGLFANSSLSDTYIKVTVKCAQLVDINLIKSLEMKNSYSRILSVIKDGDIAASILKELWKYNSCKLGLVNCQRLPFTPYREVPSIKRGALTSVLSITGSSVQSSATSQPIYRSEDENDPEEESNDYISGFFVDCLEFSLLVVEGLTIRTLPTVHELLMRIPTDEGKVLFNSNYIYMKRMYEIFKNMCGIYSITMKKAATEILKNKVSMLPGSIPAPAKNFLQNIPRLRDAKTLIPVMQNNLLPTPEELVSFEIEFGIPIPITYVKC